MSEKTNERDIFRPGIDAPAEPYWAIMEIGADASVTGNVWTHDNRIMLFESRRVAVRLLEALVENDPSLEFDVRGITSGHLDKIREIGADNDIELWVVTTIGDTGTVEGHVLDDGSDEPSDQDEVIEIELSEVDDEPDDDESDDDDSD